MPTPDPNQEMEELLRAYARQRRQDAGAPFELSPDARERLQDEVRRALRPSNVAPIPRRGISLAGWLRLALGGAVAAVLVAVLHHYTPSAASNPKTAKAPTWVSNLRALSPQTRPPTQIRALPERQPGVRISMNLPPRMSTPPQTCNLPQRQHGPIMAEPSRPHRRLRLLLQPHPNPQSAIRNPQWNNRRLRLLRCRLLQS